MSKKELEQHLRDMNERLDQFLVFLENDKFKEPESWISTQDVKNWIGYVKGA
jgi:hypothetical protein